MLDIRRGQWFVQGIRLDGLVGDIDVFDLDAQSFRLFVLIQLANTYPPFVQHFQGGQGETLAYRQRNPDIIRERRPDQRFGRPEKETHG